ncbi:MAG: CHAT domain-containing protein, partial [Kamptonema sp. SIO4C4]|nr:CHAT domain-containing protein [Kamptonema sp. SIO4C4]
MKFAKSRFFPAIVCFCLTLLFCGLIAPVWGKTPPHLVAKSPSSLGEAIAAMEEDWTREYEQYFSREFLDEPMPVAEMSRAIAKLSQASGQRIAVIWIKTKADRLQLALLTPDAQPIKRTTTGVSEQQLQQTLQSLHNNLVAVTRRHRTTYLEEAQQLYQWIIAPLEATLQLQQIDTLIFCAGPGFRLLPYGVLHDGEQFLVEHYNLATIPAFNLTSLQYNPLENAQVLAMGASEFSDLEPLPGVSAEVQTIVPNLWQGESFLNEAFTLEQLQQQRQQYPFEIIHLATHAVFNAGTPDQSYIQLSDRKLRLNEVDQLDLNQPPVELLVLSACETAIGSQQAELGFAGLALQAGVKSAIASLWRVSDVGSLALMSEFYQNLRNTSTKAAALREAQLAMIRGDIHVEGDTLY